MGPVFRLSLRQITGVRRLIIVCLLALLPVALTLILRLTSSGEGGDAQDFVNGVVDTLIVGVVLPIVTMALATSAFGNDLEDRTLSFFMLMPIARWKIALSKMAAPTLIAAPFAVLSGALSILIGLDGDMNSALAVCAGLAMGVAAYASIFTWAGLITTLSLIHI